MPLQLDNPIPTTGMAGIGMPALFIKKGEPYYTASNILGLVAQTSKGAYYTATPHLQLHTERATLDMGAVPAEKLRLFFSGLAFSIMEKLLPETFTSTEPCNKCATFGVTSITQSDLPAKRLHTNLASGQVVLLLTYNLHSEPADTTPYVTAAGVVEADGWVSFPLDKLPVRMVTDPALLKPDPANNGNGLLLRVTNTPLSHLSEGIVPLK